MKREKRLDVRQFVTMKLLFGVLVVISLATTGCNDRMARMEENQTRLQAMVAANSRQLATVSSQVYASQCQFSESIAALAQNQKSTRTEVLAVRNEQNELRETVTGGNQQLAKELAKLQHDQALLREGVMQVADTVQTTNTSVSAIAREHATLHQMVQTNKQELADEITTVAHTQQAMQKLIQSNNEQLVGRLATLAADQGQLRADLDDLRNLTQGVAADVGTVAREQASLHGTLRAQATTLADKIAVVQQNQQNMQLIIDQVANTAGGIADGVGALAAGVTSVSTGLRTLDETVRTDNQALLARTARLAESQEALEAGLGELGEQTSRVVAEQAALQQTVQNHDEAVSTQVMNLAQTQQQMLSGLDTVTGTAGQVALDVIAMNESQAALEQAVQAHREVLVGKLAEITQDQQQWLTRFDEAQTKVETMSASITALQQRIAELQGTLQTGLQGVTAQVGGETQRTRFEETVNQNMQALVEWISELREMQGSLQQQMQRVQDSTQSRNNDILSAIQQLQQKTDTDLIEAGAALKSSKATAPREVQLP